MSTRRTVTYEPRNQCGLAQDGGEHWHGYFYSGFQEIGKFGQGNEISYVR